MVIEREVKLAAPAGFRLMDLGTVADDIVVTAAPDRRFETVYWDTDDLRLIRWGTTLRYRAIEGWTVKLPLPGEGRMLTRAEHVFPGTPRQPPEGALDLVRGLLRRAELRPVTRMRTVRRIASLLSADGTRLADVGDDEVSILDGRRVAARFREVEVEAANGTPSEFIEALVDRLLAAGAGAPDPTPKLVRALGSRAVDQPEVAVPRLGSDARAGDAVCRAVAASVQRLLRHDPGVRLGEDPEAVHQARVATRRLRSDLRTFAPLIDQEWASGLRTELQWLADELGRVRDGDVLLMRLRDSVAVLPTSDRNALRDLLADQADDVAQERETLLAGMREERYLTLLDDLVDAAARPALTGEADRPAAEVLPRLVARPWRRLAHARAALNDPPSDEELHQLRILAKRARYAAEAVAPVVGKPASAFAVAAAGLQEVLGDLHDAVVAADWLRQRTGRGARRAFSVGALYALELQRAREGRESWPAAWDALDRRRLRSWM